MTTDGRPSISVHRSVTLVYVNLASEDRIRESMKHIPVGTRIVVVDNGCSRCGTDFGLGADDVTVVSVGSNIGFAAPANIGIAHASTDFVLLLNPDSLIGAESLAAMLEYAARSPRVGAMTPRLRHPTTGTDQVFGGAAYSVGSALAFALLPDRALGHRSLWARKPPSSRPLVIG